MQQQPRTVLLADAEAESFFVLRTVFEHVGYRVVSAKDNEECVSLSTTSAPDVIILDTSMLALGAADVVQRVRANPATRHVPVVALASNGSTAVEERHRGVFDCVVARPTLPSIVLDAVDDVLARPLIRD